MLKEKIVPALTKKTTSIPATTTTTTTSTASSATVASDTSNINEDPQTCKVHNIFTEVSVPTDQPTNKRKAPDTYEFKARSISICLYAPIETRHRKNNYTTGVPKGKTTKDIQYELERFILHSSNEEAPNSNNSSAEASNEINEHKRENDESFKSCFTLSKFRKDLMQLAVQKFPEEYAPKSKSHGPKCKLYIQKQWNNACWSEIATTEDLIRILKDQMEIKGRVRSNVFTIRMSFGRAKMNHHFTDQAEFDSYLDEQASSRMVFSQNEESSSPFDRRVDAITRKNNKNRTTQITDVGFLNEHGFHPLQLPPSVSRHRLPPLVEVPSNTVDSEAPRQSIVGLTFKRYGNDEEEITAIIDGELSQHSSMKNVIDKSKIANELMISDIESCKFLIKKKSESNYTLNYDTFHSMSTRDIVSLSNIDDDYIIAIRERERERKSNRVVQSAFSIWQ